MLASIRHVGTYASAKDVFWSNRVLIRDDSRRPRKSVYSDSQDASTHCTIQIALATSEGPCSNRDTWIASICVASEKLRVTNMKSSVSRMESSLWQSRMLLVLTVGIVYTQGSALGESREEVKVPAGKQAEVAGVKVKFVDYQGPATFSVAATGKHELQIAIDPGSERKPLTVGVELPISGRNAWPVVDVEVVDSNGRSMSVRRSGIEWHKLLIPVPARLGTYVVHVVDPPGDRPRPLPEEGRHVMDSKTGLSASTCRWYDGREAALSIRFDDSHPTHLSKAIPILREYGFRGTFMVNPGRHPPNSRKRSAFEDHRSEWEACARHGDQEFANHTLHHSGAPDDESMEREIGEASKAIWRLFPDKSKLLALNLGGGTRWETTRTLRYYLDKYHLFDASTNSTGMDDTYGNRVATFRRFLERHIERGLWYKAHYHYIGEGLSSSEANFRAVLDIAKEHEAELWIAGMADIHKYRTERRCAMLSIECRDDRRAVLRLSCSTEPELYDQPLTIDVTLPQSWGTERVVVMDAKAHKIDTRRILASGKVVLRFDAWPADSEYTIEWAPNPD